MLVLMSMIMRKSNNAVAQYHCAMLYIIYAFMHKKATVAQPLLYKCTATLQFLITSSDLSAFFVNEQTFVIKVTITIQVNI